MKENRTHAFFSHFRPDFLFKELNKAFTDNGQAFEISEQSWKINFVVERQIDEQANEENQEQAAAQQVGEPVFERANIQVEILKVPDQEKFCCDFQRKAGSAMLFYDTANKYMDLLLMCNNTTIDADDSADNQAAAQ